jgi:phosphodiesterase/alkaline phosphatase D-like protein
MEFQYDPIRNNDDTDTNGNLVGTGSVLEAYRRDNLAASNGVTSFYESNMTSSARGSSVSRLEAMMGGLAFYLTTRTANSQFYNFGDMPSPDVSIYQSPTGTWIGDHWAGFMDVAEQQLGDPVGAPYQLTTGTDPEGHKYRVIGREYTNGFSLVRARGNWDQAPSAGSAAVVTLPRSLRPVDVNGVIGSATTQTTMINGQGKFFLNASGGGPADTIAPAAVSNLAITASTSSSVSLSWTATGDDGSTGAASSYDLRYSTAPITSGNFASATQVSGEPTPGAAGSAQSMTVSSLSANTLYYFALQVSDEVPNTSALSNIASGSTAAVTAPDTTAPAAITNLAVSGTTASSISLSWTATGDDGSTGTAASYDLRYSTSPITSSNFASALAASGEPTPGAAGSAQSMTVSGLSASTQYYFAIKVSDEIPNTSAISNLPSGTTAAVSGGPDTTPPAQITNLAASSITSSSLTLSWTAPGDDGSTGTAYRYFLMFSTSPIDSSNFWSSSPINYVPLPAAAGSAQSVSITGLNANSTYYFALRTRDDAFNDSSNSNIVSANTAGLPTSGDTVAPAAVFDLRPTSISSGTVVLSWTAPGDDSWTGTATTYDARFSTAVITSANFAGASQLAGEPTPAAAGTSQSMTISNLGNGTKYYYAIRVGDEVMNVSPLSNVTSATASANPTGLDNTPPATISNLSSSNITSSSLTLSWTAPGNDGASGLAAAYDIRYGTSPITSANFYSSASVINVPTPSTAGASESLNISNLSAGTTYYFAIKTSDAALNSSGISNVINVTTTGAVTADTIAPSAITNLSIIASTQNSITIQWTAPGDDGAIGTASQYDIRYATTEFGAAIFTNATQVTSEPVPLSAGTIQSMTISGLTAGTSYYIVMVSSDEVSNISSPSNIASGATAAAPVIDNTAPAAVTNLAVPVIATNTAIVTWTAPGDDGAVGTAASYDLRYSTSPINSGNFNSATTVVGEPNPRIAGTAESMTITGLSAGTTYYFALKVSDEVPNTSPISNIAQATTGTPPPPPDTTAPAAISTLAVQTVSTNSAIVTWTAPGDDGTSGTAASYDLRYSTSPINSGNFNSAISVTGEPAPAVAGTAQSMTIAGLSAGTTYYFAIMTSDEVPNSSGISNVVSGTTLTIPSVDTAAPAAISNLAVSSPTSSSLNISWTAPGDDGTSGTAASYDLRYSTSPINSGNFNSAISVTGEPAPAVAGTAQSMTVSGLSASTVYYFAIKTSDEVLNVSAISNIVSGTTSAAAVNPPPTGGGGGGGGGGGATGDTTAPAAITNLRAVSSGSGVTLSWTAPGDDGATGSAYIYDLRYSNQPIDLSTFDRATSASGEPVPGVAGSSQSMAIANLTPNIPYYFAVRTADEVLNWSALSNVPTITLAATTVVIPNAPATVSTIIITNSGAGSVSLKWIQPQSANPITSYDVRYSTQAITEANFSSAKQATGVTAPTVAGASHSVVIKNLTPNKKYYFTVKAVNSSGGSTISKLVCTPRRLPLSLQTGQTVPDYCQAYSPYPRAKK